MAGSAPIVWLEICGNRTRYDAFWDEKLTVETFSPALTDCFQKTVLVWVPCGWLWLTSLVYLPSLCRQDSLHTRCSITMCNLWKMLLVSLAVVVSLVDVAEVVDKGTSSDGTIPVEPIDYAATVIRALSAILAAFLTRYSYIKGHHTSGVLFLFWLLSTLCGVLQIISMVSLSQNEDYIIDSSRAPLFYVYFGSVVLLTISNAFADESAIIPDHAAMSQDDERKPLLANDTAPVDLYTGKNPNPRDYASFLSTAFFFWFSPMVVRGYKKALTYADMWDIRKEDSSKTITEMFQKNWEAEQSKCRKSGKDPSLTKVMVKTFFSKLFLAGILLALWQTMQLINPTILNAVIAFVQGDSPYVWQGYTLAVLMFCCSTLGCLFMHNSFFMSYHIGMHLKSAVITAVYRKALRISNSARKSAATGEIVNLMSVDAQKVQDSQMFINFLWITPLSLIVTVYMLYGKLGPSCFAGLAYLIIVIPINSMLVGKMIAKYQGAQMKWKDYRIKLMSQILAGIKVLKLYAWEPYFEKKILSIRSEELIIQRKAAIISSISYILSVSSTFIVALLCFGTFVLSSSDHVLTPDITFVSISLFGILSMPLAIIPAAVMMLINGMVSLGRIKKFLLQPEIDSDNVQHSSVVDGSVRIRDATFSWGEADRIPLKDINLVVAEGSLVAIVGTVGSGKSSLIQAMLGEMEVSFGDVNVKGSVAYVPQQAWIQNLTVRDNILFDKSFSRPKYDRVLEACALEPDLKILAGGDMTEIGERGINLSGGQKQRVSLARALYQNADVYLLDDPLSAVDSHVGKHIFQKVIGPHGLLSHKTRVLVTNALTFLSQVDKIVVLKDGTISEMGSYDELLEKNGAFAEFVNQYLTQVDDGESDDSETENFKRELVRRLSSSAAGILSESATSGTEGDTTEGGTKKLRHRSRSRKESASRKASEGLQVDKKKKALILEESVEEGTVKGAVIAAYVKAASLTWALVASLGLIVTVSGTVGTNIWLSEWSNDAERNITQQVDLGLRLGIYGLLGVIQSCGVFALSAATAYGCIEAAKRLHHRLLTNNLRSPMSFFDTTPLGRILNRFSKDIDTVDADLRMYITNWLSTVGNIVSTLIIVIYSTPIFIAVIIPLGFIFFCLQRVYINTARQIKRIDSIKRSPMYSNFSETLNGVSSIRAYKQEKRFITLADELLDNSQKVWFPVFTSNRWISIWAEMIGDTIVLFAAIFCIIQRETLDGGTVGLSLSFALQVSFQIVIAVRYSCELETYIVAVERIKEYSETPTEAPWKLDHQPPLDWPSQGVMDFIGYKTRYRPGLELVLKDISCHIEPAEMVGIIGRTGAGKSSMTLALFRIIEAAGGSILIDGENLAEMGLHDVRSKLTIIPQDPVLFSGSLRFNIDPADQYSDAEVWTALEQAHLKDFVETLPESLMYESGEDGQNFSVGQRQLVCLARALLRKTKILVLDEATAAVDLETDDLIQTTIRAEFKGCTVLTIAHRLNTIMDYDRVMVMDAGYIKEFDKPGNLLKDTSSMFYGMASDAGLI